MAGYRLILKIRELEERCDRLGFMMCHSRHSYGEFGEFVAIKPKDQDAFPIYSRDAEFFVGTIEALEQWLRGLEWARDYDRMLDLSNDKKRARKEQDARNRRMLQQLREANPAVVENK